MKAILLFSFSLILCKLLAQELTTEFKTKCATEKAYKPGKGFVAVINCNTSFNGNYITNFFFAKGRCMPIPYRIFNASSFEIKNAQREKKRCNANAAIFIVSDKDLPFSFNSPEEGWAVINFGVISSDKAPERIIIERMDKMFSRATMQILGAGSFMSFNNSATKLVQNLKDLDSLIGKSPAPEAMSSMYTYMRCLGFREPREAPYYVACQQGWANTPTNDVQKYIWDAVHSAPKNPIRIEFDPKTGR